MKRAWRDFARSSTGNECGKANNNLPSPVSIHACLFSCYGAASQRATSSHRCLPAKIPCSHRRVQRMVTQQDPDQTVFRFHKPYTTCIPPIQIHHLNTPRRTTSQCLVEEAPEKLGNRVGLLSSGLLGGGSPLVLPRGDPANTKATTAASWLKPCPYTQSHPHGSPSTAVSRALARSYTKHGNTLRDHFLNRCTGLAAPTCV